MVAEQIQRGNTLPLSGSFSGVKIAYLPTDRDLGVFIEIFSGTPGTVQEPGATWAGGGERHASRVRRSSMTARNGRIVFEGTPADLVAARSTLTDKHLAASLC